MHHRALLRISPVSLPRPRRPLGRVAGGHTGRMQRRPGQGAGTLNPNFTHPGHPYGSPSVVSGNRGSERRQRACLPILPIRRREKAPVSPPAILFQGCLPGFRPPYPSPPPTSPPARHRAHSRTFCRWPRTRHCYQKQRRGESRREERRPEAASVSKWLLLLLAWGDLSWPLGPSVSFSVTWGSNATHLSGMREDSMS